ncbi:hypothetical protein LXL04_004802 [Taraxacum kok-saghyz]
MGFQQAFGWDSKVVFGGQVTDEEVESLNKRYEIQITSNAHVDEEPVAVGNEEPEAFADDANDHVYEEQVYDEHMVTTNGSGGFVANKRRLPSQRITKLKLKKRVLPKMGVEKVMKILLICSSLLVLFKLCQTL